MGTYIAMQSIDHATWCDRHHPQTDDGQSYLVLERNHIRPTCRHIDQPLIEDLFNALGNSLADAGHPIPRELTDQGPVIRLCAASRLRRIEQQVALLIASGACPSKRIM